MTRERPDGRRAWRERNRNAVVDALLDLYQEGKLTPGAQEVAERSGVSRRSLFRYFDDMDDMCRFAIERHAERVGHLFDLEGIGEGTFEERIDRLVKQRVELFETIAPVRRSARIRAPFQPIIEAELERTRMQLRKQVARQFAPELDKMEPSVRRAVLAMAELTASFESFEQLRSDQRLSAKQAADVMRLGLTSLLVPSP